MNGVLDVSDIDLLTAKVALSVFDETYDLNRDGILDQDDRRYWVEDLKRTFFGDANLDGEFNAADLVSVFQAGEYEDHLPANSTWADGDWSGDREFGTEDLVLAFRRGGFELGPRAIIPVVPEPQSSWLLLSAVVFFCSVAIRSAPAGRAAAG